MDSAAGSEVAVDLSPLVRVYKDGRVERLMGTDSAPAGADPKTGVISKDVAVSPHHGVSARIYLPATAAGKLPVLVYFHGGAFIVESVASPTYHNYMNALVAGARIAAVSIGYRRAPEHPLPTAYGDSWAALKWVASHSAGDGPERWLNHRADPTRLFLAGDSAGANIAHRLAVRSGEEDIGGGVKIKGIALIHPYFWGEDPVWGEPVEPMIGALWQFVCPGTVGSDDPWINPEKDPDVGNMGCGKVLVCVAEKDVLRQRGRLYCEVLRRSGWAGSVEIVESEGEGHIFHLVGDPAAERAVALLDKVSSFINQD